MALNVISGISGNFSNLSSTIKEINVDNFKGKVKDVLFKRQNTSQVVEDNLPFPLTVVFTEAQCFDYEVKMQSDITQHTVEDGTIISDHKVNKPVEISLKGQNAEVVYLINPTIQYVSSAISQLGVVNDYIPNLTTGVASKMSEIQQQVVAGISYVERGLANAQGFANLLTDKNGIDSKIQEAIKTIEDGLDFAYTIELDGLQYENMYITSFSYNKNNTTPYNIDISISLKEVKKANSQLATILNTTIRKSGAGNSINKNVNNGTDKGEKQPLESKLSKLWNNSI